MYRSVMSVFQTMVISLSLYHQWKETDLMTEPSANTLIDRAFNKHQKRKFSSFAEHDEGS
jgi:hypothetical protein